jgi:Mg-chelatase subunit ChlD
MKKKVKAKPQKTLVSFILDETGSMSNIRGATITGFNEYVKSLKGDIRMTLTKFNSIKTDIVYNAKRLSDIPKLSESSYVPDGMTPLYDAIGATIKKLETESKESEVLVVIMTDGEENFSREFDRKKIFDLIEEKKRKGWMFTFLGANQDAWQTGLNMGIAQANSINFVGTAASTKQAFYAAASATNAYSLHASKTRMDGAFNAKNVEDLDE